jgi:hypothetical protein
LKDFAEENFSTNNLNVKAAEGKKEELNSISLVGAGKKSSRKP